jgi:hypothetical protein
LDHLNFTKETIESLPVPKSGRFAFYDDGDDGLGVRVEASGRKRFFWFRKVMGMPTYKPIGAVGACSIQTARDTAKEWTENLSEWKRHGYKEDKNPFEKPRGELTFAQLIERYIQGRVHKKANQPEKAEKAVRWIVKKYLSQWNGRKLDQIRRQEVRVLHDHLGREHGRVTADRCVQLIRRVYYWAASEKVELWSGENPRQRSNSMATRSGSVFFAAGRIGAPG